MYDTNFDPINRDNFETRRWAEATHHYDKIHTIKKIGLEVIKLLNIAAIVAGLVLIVQFVPIPINPITELLIASPFILGILIALDNNKISLGPLTRNRKNWKDEVNPAVQIAKIVTSILVAPYLFCRDRCDLTPYHDSDEAINISTRLRRGSFAELIQHHGQHLDNLQKYGFVNQNQLVRIKKIYNDYISNKIELEELENKHLSVLQYAREEVREFEQPWEFHRRALQLNQEVYEDEWRSLQNSFHPIIIT